MEFENTVDCEPDMWIHDCACHDVWSLGPKQNVAHRSFFSLGR